MQGHTNIYKQALKSRGPPIQGSLDFSTEMGFSATDLKLAIEIFNKAIENNAKIYLAFTSNAGTSGIRDLLAQFIRDYNVTAIFTTAGAIEEDIMKSFRPFTLQNQIVSDIILRQKGLNRSANILVDNNHYINFSNLIEPYYQLASTKTWIKPSELINKLGSDCLDENSIIRQAYLKKCPVYAQALEDGAFGDALYFFNMNHTLYFNSSLDYMQSFKMALDDLETGQPRLLLILGGGTPKHHCCNISLISGGADYAIYFNTGIQRDGSNASAPPEEAISWGKLKPTSINSKVFGDFTINFPVFLYLIKSRKKLH